MAFANLFTKLCASTEDVRTPEQPAFTQRNNPEDGARGTKRKTEAEQAVFHKKRRNQGQKSFNNGNSKAKQTTDGAGALGYNKEVNNHNEKGHNAHHKGQNNTNGNKCKVNKKRHPEKRTEGQKNWHQWKERGRHGHGDGGKRTGRGGGGHNKKQFNDKQRTCFMSQEFKDQNALLVDGRLICRHFLWGRCIKADECQLEHVQGYNDLLKEVCKFYVQGFCTKGESCPYMHKSFPCKFFHRKGKCSQGADCKFSHEPLTDVTKQLLDEALKRSELYEVAKKGQEETSGQPVNAEPVSEVTEATPDLLLQPLRPNFYNSTSACAEKEACQTEEQEAAIPPQTPSDSAQPHSPPSATPISEEPVCYSVEAMLGPQLSRPLFSFFTPPGRQSLSDPQTTCDNTLSAANTSEAPYSVDAVLKSCKSVDNSTFGQTFHTPPAVKTVSYYPLTDSQKVTDPLLHSKYQNEKTSLQTKDEVNKEKHRDMKDTMASDTHALRPSGPTESKPSEQRCASKHLTEVKPHLPAQTVNTRSSLNHFPFSLEGCEVKAAERCDSNSAARHLAAERLSEIEQRCKNIQPGLKVQTQHVKSEKISAGRSSTTTDSGNKRPFQSLFAGLVGDDPGTPTPESVSDVTERSQSAGLTRKDTDEGQSNKTFLSLFSAPLTETAATPPPLSQDSKQKASSSDPSLPSQVRTGTQDSPPPEESEVSGPNPCAAVVQQQPLGISSPGAVNSVLKSLFLCLSPYQEDGEQRSSAENELKDRSAVECGLVKERQKKKKGRRQKKRPVQEAVCRFKNC